MSVRTQPDDRSTAATRGIGRVTGWLGSFPAILLSFSLVALWVVGGLYVRDGFSNDTYQLVITSGTAIVTFWMVFIIQNTQNREGRAMQAKLDAQSDMLRRMAEKLGIEEGKAVLSRTVGLEDAPERVIKADQDMVRGSNAVVPFTRTE